MKTSNTFLTVALVALGMAAGSAMQRVADSKIVAHAAEQRIGTMYQTPRGDNWALAHIYMPECAAGHKRVVEAPERDERDFLAVYCYDGEQSTKDELEAMAGNN